MCPTSAFEGCSRRCRPPQAEADENTQRKDFTPLEGHAIGAALRPIEEAAAKERQREHAGTAPGKPNTSVNLTEVLPKKSDRESRKRVAKAVGMSAATLDKIEAVVAAAEKDPELGAIVAKMEESGRVDPAYRAVKKKEAEKDVSSPATLDSAGRADQRRRPSARCLLH